MAEWYDVRNYGAVGDGATDDSTAFTNAQTAAASSRAWVFVSPGTYRIATPPNGGYTAPFFFAAGGQLWPDAGKVLEFAGAVQAPITRLFAGSGSIVFNYDTLVRPEWWGAVADGATDDSAAIQAAISSLSSGGVVELRARSYAIATYLRVTSSHVTICGVGQNATQLIVTNGLGSGIAVLGSTINQNYTQVSNCRVANLSVVKKNPDNGGAGIELYYTAVARIENVQVSGFLNGISLRRATNTQIDRALVTAAGPLSNFVGFSIDGSPGGFSTTTTNATTAGSNTVFNVAADPSRAGVSSGDSIVVDANGQNQEACIVTAITATTITVASTQYAHASGITIIDYFGASAGYLGTSSNATTVGTNTVFNVSPDPTRYGINVNDPITVELGGPNQETCVVSALTSTTITVASTGKSHASGVGIYEFIGGRGDTHGNVSSVFRDCWVDAGSNALSSIGIKIFASYAGNADCGDLLFDAPQTASTAYGMSLDFSNVMTYSDADSDIEILNPVLDYWWVHGIYINGPGSSDVTSAVSISGGFISPNPDNEQAQYDAIYISNMRGVSISNVQFAPPVTSRAAGNYNAFGITANSAQNIAVRGCLFNGQSLGLWLSGCSFCSVNGNSFFSTPQNGVGKAMNPALTVTGGSRGIVVNSNTFDATVAGGMVSSISVDSTAQGCIVIGNACSSRITNAAPQVYSGNGNVNQFNVVT